MRIQTVNPASVDMMCLVIQDGVPVVTTYHMSCDAQDANHWIVHRFDYLQLKYW